MCDSTLIFVLLCGISYGFILTSSTNPDSLESNFLQAGKTWVYEYSVKTTLNGKEEGETHVGDVLKSTVTIESVWSSEGFDRILKFNLEALNFQNAKNEHFYVLWKKGVVDRVLFRKEEELPLVNLKKGIASLFQLQFQDSNIKEQDASGVCDVTYRYSTKTKMEKTKTFCENNDLPLISNIEPILSLRLNSLRTTNYNLNPSIDYIETVYSEENHQVYLPTKEEIGTIIRVEQVLKLTDVKDCKNCVLKEKSYEEVKQKLIDEIGFFKEENLLTEKDFSRSKDEKTFPNLVNEHRDNIKAKHLGKLTSAKAVILLVNSARKSKKEDIMKVLNLKKNQKILPQLYDILGYVQTEISHEAVMKKLHFDDVKNEDNTERYLWACQLSPHPNSAVVIDLLNKYKKTENVPKKIQETLVLSISSMASKLAGLNKLGHSKVVGIVQETLINYFDAGDKEERVVFLRGLRNLKSPRSIPKLLQIISDKDVSFKEEVLAWKAIRAMDLKSWDDKVFATAFKAYFQLDKKHDSSSRTLAVDVLLQSNPNDDVLRDLLRSLLVDDKEFEVKKYLLQQIEMICTENEEFKERVLNIIKANKKLNNYSTLSPKGLSLSLSTKVFVSNSSNGSLLTIQEMSSGIVKRGVVDVILDKDDTTQELFSLGMFSGGLGSFLSSDSSDPEEVATAGIELAILGSQIRPFVFFEGQGELMGHVWSGTASERTTAFQSLILLQDHQEFLRLGSGFIAHIDFKGAASFDLAGKIEMSLWNRNAQAVIEKSLGYIGIGTTNLDSSFGELGVEYQTSIEPSLLLNADIDFSSKVALCLRLSQPEAVFRYSVHKTEKVPNGKRTSKKKHRKVPVPGRTYALNRQNDEKCSEMFNS